MLAMIKAGICLLLSAGTIILAKSDSKFQPSIRDNGTSDGMERWGYVDIREGAHLFWWLYYTYHSDSYLNRPWIIWLQVNEVSVLFLDQPVGTGYSYVDDPQYYATDNQEVAMDMLSWIKVFLENYPEFQTLPLYIFGESYGGKMGSNFAYELYNVCNSVELISGLS
ncbi:hypothetical protein LSH36_1793g00012 [Paralvinella palmiformis]|uniref:Carboxypeptidase n=1 Tax=Paralvinella palmiformis TaxID=53620 RepID=A0AAD9MQP3_9ANNE|nr:hypothetical protein LSH36_1793g00012 [Paralvinella palmiformis]